MKLAIVGDLHLDSKTPAGRTDDFFKTMEGKIQQIEDKAGREGCEAVLQTGDVFNRVGISRLFIGQVIRMFKQTKFDWYTVAGNHDLKWDRIDKIDETPLGILLETGYIKDLTKEKPEGLDIEAYHFTKDIEVEGKSDMMLGHWYFEDNYNKERETITEEQVADYKLVVLGHEHDTATEDNVVVPGSIARLSSHEHNLTRTPCFFVVDTDDYSYERIDLEVEDSEEVFNQEKLKDKEEDNHIKEFVNELSEGVDQEDNMDFLEIVKEVTDNEEIVDTCDKYIKEAV